ncbi:MAG TPA: F0F1 ATP synthase subunit delta [Acidimicrobiia bacterium]|nr:F0F1 ATP synthase subunit delta [Acidimicrobiia bacterium]
MLIDWFTVAAQIVNFLILVALLRFFLYRRILDAIATRQGKIAAAFTESETREHEAQQTVDEHAAELERMAEERPHRLEQLEAEMRQERSRMLAELRHEIEEIRDDWYRGVLDERERLIDELETRLAAGAEVVARAALTDLADLDLESRMIDVFLRRLEAMDEGQLGSLVAAIGDATTTEVASSFPVPSESRSRIRDRVADRLGVTRSDFRVDPSLGCGIELRAGGRTVGWSLDRYLDQMRAALEDVVESSTGDVGTEHSTS